MSCDFYILLINGHLDNANTTEEEKQLQEHLQSCEACRSLLSVMQENDAMIKADFVQPPEDLTAKIMQTVRKHPKRNRRKTFYTSLAATGLAAAAMLGIFLSGNFNPPENEGISVVSETEQVSFSNSAKRSVPTAVGVLVLPMDRADIDFEGEALNISNLPSTVARAGYAVTGNEKEAYSVTWDELLRLRSEHGGSFYNPDANTQGIVIFVD